MNKKLALYIGLFFSLVILLIITFIIINKKILNREEYNRILRDANNTNETIIKTIVNPGSSFVNNQVLIMFNDKASKEEVEKSLKSIPNVVETDSLFDYSYSLTLDITFNNLEELHNYCKEIQKDKLITVCEPNHIIKIDDCSKGPC